jgi:hypothetical protein
METRDYIIKTGVGISITGKLIVSSEHEYLDVYFCFIGAEFVVNIE